MLKMPYTFYQAQELCEKLQYLVGQAFDVSTDYYSAVECVAISPFDNLSKKSFLLNYLLCTDAEKSLWDDYKGPFFDVVVIARVAENALDLIQEDIATWIKRNNFNIAEIPAIQEI
jgi:hypothetical protein